MSNTFEFEAQVRADLGKGASRRLRRQQNAIPAIMYGGGQAPTSLTLDHDKVINILKNEAIYTQIVTVNMGNKKEKAILKDIQRHHYKPKVIHMDFQRIQAGHKVNMNIPLHFSGEKIAPGVARDKGLISHHLTHLEVTCLPEHLPAFVEVDVSKLNLDETIHLSDIMLPPHVEFSTPPDEEHDLPVISIQLLRMKEEPAEGAPVVPAGAVPALSEKAEKKDAKPKS